MGLQTKNSWLRRRGWPISFALLHCDARPTKYTRLKSELGRSRLSRLYSQPHDEVLSAALSWPLVTLIRNGSCRLCHHCIFTRINWRVPLLYFLSNLGHITPSSFDIAHLVILPTSRHARLGSTEGTCTGPEDKEDKVQEWLWPMQVEASKS